MYDHLPTSRLPAMRLDHSAKRRPRAVGRQWVLVQDQAVVGMCLGDSGTYLSPATTDYRIRGSVVKSLPTSTTDTRLRGSVVDIYNLPSSPVSCSIETVDSSTAGRSARNRTLTCLFSSSLSPTTSTTGTFMVSAARIL